MRRFSVLLSTLMIISMLLAACGGEETSTTVPSTNVPPVTSEATSTSSVDMTETPATSDLTTTPGVPVTGGENPSRVSNMLDFKVVDQSGQDLGEVDDLVLDLDNANISYVVVGTGGVLDLGQKKVLIPWNSLTLQTATSGATGSPANAFVLQGDAQMLQNAPSVDLNSVLPGKAQPAGDWDTDIRNFWESGGTGTGTGTGLATATTSAGGTGLATATTSAGVATALPEMTATSSSNSGTGNGNGIGLGLGSQLQGVMLASDVIGSTIMIGAGNNANGGNGTGNGQGSGTGQGNGLATATTVPGGAVATATTSPGSALATATLSVGNGTGLGSMQATIKDLIADPNTGDIKYIVISIDDNADNWIPVPLSFLQWDATNTAFLLNVNANAIQNAPFFTEDQFPDTSTSGWDQTFSDFWNNNGTGTGVTGPAVTATP